MAGNVVVNFLIGFLVSVLASVMNAAGLNLLKLDHVRNASRPQEHQKNECGRPLWHFGLYLYIASQLIGSTIALNFLKAQWVAPLGSISLIFNFIFARTLIGTRITRKDILGTFVVIISVIWIVVFGGMNTGQSDENLTIEKLKSLMMRPLFIVYFSFLNLITFSLFGVAVYTYWILIDEDRKRRDNYFRTIETNRLKKAVGMIMSGCGGLLASQSLLLAKSGVKLFYISVTDKNQFTDSVSVFILISLGVTAILQVYCLNTALKLHDSVLVVPMFYGFYTAMGLLNSVIYLDELSTYPFWALMLVTVGIATLVYGVILLSESKEEPVISTKDFEDYSEDEDELKYENKNNINNNDSNSNMLKINWNDNDNDNDSNTFSSISNNSSASEIGLTSNFKKRNNNNDISLKGNSNNNNNNLFKFISNKKIFSNKSLPGIFRFKKNNINLTLSDTNNNNIINNNNSDSESISEISLENSQHVIIEDYDNISYNDDDDNNSHFINNPTITSPEPSASYDLIVFSPTAIKTDLRSSSSQSPSSLSSITNNSNFYLTKENRQFDNDENNSIIYSNSFEDILKIVDNNKN